MLCFHRKIISNDPDKLHYGRDETYGAGGKREKGSRRTEERKANETEYVSGDITYGMRPWTDKFMVSFVMMRTQKYMFY